MSAVDILSSATLTSVTVSNTRNLSQGIGPLSVPPNDDLVCVGDRLRILKEQFTASSTVRALFNSGVLELSAPVYEQNTEGEVISRREAKPMHAYVTLGVPGKAGVDFTFTSAANTTAQNKNLGALFPAGSLPLNINIQCTEDVEDASDPQTMTFVTGKTSAQNDLIASNTCDEAGDILNQAAGSSPIFIVSAADTNVWVQGTPGANWSTLEKGTWLVTATYIPLK